MNILIEQRKSPISIETYWALPLFCGYSYLMLATSINERSAELATRTDIHLKRLVPRPILRIRTV